MKKIIFAILFFSSSFILFSCGNNAEMQEVNKDVVSNTNTDIDMNTNANIASTELTSTISLSGQKVEGDVLTFHLKLSDVKDVMGIDVSILFDPAVLQFDGAEQKNIKNFLFYSNLKSPNEISLLFASGESVDLEDEIIATVQFTVLKKDKTSLSFGHAEILDSKSNSILVKQEAHDVVY